MLTQKTTSPTPRPGVHSAIPPLGAPHFTLGVIKTSSWQQTLSSVPSGDACGSNSSSYCEERHKNKIRFQNSFSVISSFLYLTFLFFLFSLLHYFCLFLFLYSLVSAQSVLHPCFFFLTVSSVILHFCPLVLYFPLLFTTLLKV